MIYDLRINTIWLKSYEILNVKHITWTQTCAHYKIIYLKSFFPSGRTQTKPNTQGPTTAFP